MVIAGAVIGAPLRYLIDRGIQTRHRTPFPWGTLAVNLIACAGLGFLTGAATVAAVPPGLQHLVGPGLCATLSTYSTFSYETVRLVETGHRVTAIANAIGSTLAGIGFALLGSLLAGAVLAR
nr:fluoride efflux transporter CrcB [Kribbella italica]